MTKKIQRNYNNLSKLPNFEVEFQKLCIFDLLKYDSQIAKIAKLANFFSLAIKIHVLGIATIGIPEKVL